MLEQFSVAQFSMPIHCGTVKQAAVSQNGKPRLQAKLSFAHAETIIPLACLLGLFSSHDQQAQRSDWTLGQHSSSTDPSYQSQQSAGAVHETADDIAGGTQCMDDSDSQCKLDEEVLQHCNADQEGNHQIQGWAPPLPRPPKARTWHGSAIAPYGANIQFVLHPSQVTQPRMREMQFCII